MKPLEEYENFFVHCKNVDLGKQNILVTWNVKNAWKLNLIIIIVIIIDRLLQ